MTRMKTIVNCVLTHRGKERCILTLTLNPENHHYVCAFNRILYSLLNSQTLLDKFGKLRWYHRARPGNSDGCPELGKQIDVRSRHS